ncbi:enoyl-CoA hydratase/isomerase [Dipodascopsis tothii]|uniref:enoyl-CoA hydratase/isomerase n=1 Tax=Dipodascopsis tothii TaxID=44089 RepID=UPI0034CF588C
MTDQLPLRLPRAAAGQAEPPTLITLSKTDKYYLITMSHGQDNRMTSAFNMAFLQALDVLETVHLPRQRLPLVTTSANPKFFSNGLDLQHAISTHRFWNDSFYMLMQRLLAYPVPCIAWINGHAFAGGFIIAMCHDYRVMNPDKGFLCMNEIEFDAPLKGPLSSLFRQKTTPTQYQRIALEAARFTSEAALREGLIHARGAEPEVAALAAKLGRVAQANAYGEMKETMWAETIAWCNTEFKDSERRV